MLYYAQGSPDLELTADDCRKALTEVLEQFVDRDRVLVVPPDYTRFDSQSGMLTSLLYDLLGSRLTDVLPALGTHDMLSDEQIERMLPGVKRGLFREHRWREDAILLDHVPGDYVSEVTEGIYDKPWPVEVNRMIADRTHDLVISVGQVVPHEVIGMANYNKNLFVGTGGR